MLFSILLMKGKFEYKELQIKFPNLVLFRPLIMCNLIVKGITKDKCPTLFYEQIPDAVS